MRSWWKAVVEAWFRHAVPMDADPGGPFRPFVEEPRSAGPSLGRLDPGAEARPAAPGRPDHDWGLSYPPPAA